MLYRPRQPDGKAVLEQAQRPVVMTCSLTKPHQAGIEGDQRHQYDVGCTIFCFGWRLQKTEWPGFERIAGRPAQKPHGRAAAGDMRQRGAAAMRNCGGHQRCGIGLAILGDVPRHYLIWGKKRSKRGRCNRKGQLFLAIAQMFDKVITLLTERKALRGFVKFDVHNVIIPEKVAEPPWVVSRNIL